MGYPSFPRQIAFYDDTVGPLRRKDFSISFNESVISAAGL